MSLLEWLKSHTLMISNAGEDVEQLELSFIAGGSIKGYKYLVKGLIVSYKIKHNGWTLKSLC